MSGNTFLAQAWGRGGGIDQALATKTCHKNNLNFARPLYRGGFRTKCLQYILTVISVSIKSVLVLCFTRSAMLFYSVTSDSIIQMCWLSSSAPPGIVYLVLQQSPAQSRLADGLPSLLPSPMDHDTSWPGLVNCTHLVNKYIVTDHMNILHSITHVFCNSTSYM